MSNILVSKNEMLVVCVNQPASWNNIGRPVQPWVGVLEAKCQDYTIDQIAALASNPEHVVRILKIGEHGAITNITDTVLDYMESNQ